MNAPFRSADFDWTFGQTDARACVDDPRAMKLAARLAAAIVAPISILADAAVLPAWPEAVVKKMAAHRHFSAPVQRAVARALDLDAMALAPEFFDRLAERPASRLCVALVTDPLPQIRAVAADLAATILHRRILQVVLKPHRAKLRAALGEEGLRLATQEAPMLYSNLADLDRGALFDACVRDQDEPELRETFTDIGMAGLGRLIEFCEPELRGMFARRSPGSGPALGAFTESQCDHALKLFRRRTPAWLAIID